MSVDPAGIDDIVRVGEGEVRVDKARTCGFNVGIDRLVLAQVLLLIWEGLSSKEMSMREAWLFPELKRDKASLASFKNTVAEAQPLVMTAVQCYRAIDCIDADV